MIEVGLDGHLRWLRGHFLLILTSTTSCCTRKRSSTLVETHAIGQWFDSGLQDFFVSPFCLVKTHVELELLLIFGNSILSQSHPTVTGSIPVCKNFCLPQLDYVRQAFVAQLVSACVFSSRVTSQSIS